MKKMKKALVLTLAALALGACGEVKSEDPSSIESSISDVVSSSEESSSSSSSSSSVEEEWSEEEIALMNEYCGGVLPKLQSNTTGKITFEETEDYYGNKFLVIYNEAESFTIQDYYLDLADNGWNVIKGYNGKAVQTDSTGIKFVELTSASEDKETGYDMVYYHRDASTDSDGNTVAACNIIQCYNDLTGVASSATAWDEEEKEAMVETLTVELPFINLGSSNRVYARSTDVLSIIDVYTEDLTATYVKALVADGFKIDTMNSYLNDEYILSKTLSDGATIDAYLYYMNGNTFNFVYTPSVTTYTSWPTEELEEIKNQTGVTIPEFAIDEGGHYYVFKKNGVLYIQGETTTVDSWSYETYLNEAGLIQYNWGDPYINWDENLAVTCDDIYDENYSTIGIQVSVELTTPTSSFATSWPSEEISSAITNLFGVEGYTLPALDNISDYTSDKIKYEVLGEDYIASQYEYYLEDIAAFPNRYEDLPEDYTEEDIENLARELAQADAGITIKIKDNAEFATYNAYEALLDSLAYHSEYGWSGKTFEDKDGKVSINIDGTWYEDYDMGVTTVTIKKGSGETHTPTLEFASESYEIGIGKSQKLQVNKDMLPYEISYSSTGSENISVNSKGFVSVSEDATDGETATITASVTTSEGETISTSCTVTAIEVLDYDKDSAIEAVADLLVTEGYEEPTIESDDDSSSIKLTFDTSTDTSVTAEGLRNLAETKLIPEGFVINYGMDVDTGDDITWSNRWKYENGEEVGSGMSMDVNFYYQDDEMEKVTMMYFVYTLNDDPNTLILEITAYNTDF